MQCRDRNVQVTCLAKRKRCIEAAFQFLLDREPKESILRRFDVTVILPLLFRVRARAVPLPFAIVIEGYSRPGPPSDRSIPTAACAEPHPTKTYQDQSQKPLGPEELRA